MPKQLQPHPTFAGRPGPVLIVVADGVGIAPPGPSNAVTEARTPTLDRLNAASRATTLAAHGIAVGLPTDDDMGNSEVGHNALGAGRIFAQGAKLVNQAMDSGSLFATPVWNATVDHSRTGTLHLIGLHSNGNVHSHTEQMYRLIDEAIAQGVSRIRLHLLLDGRDVPPRSALPYLAETERRIAQHNANGADVAIASGGGRMIITMDRYEADWSMVERGYNCHTHGVGRSFSSATEAVETLYAESDKGDQNLEQFVIVDTDDQPVGTMVDGDAVVFFNFRGDRAIEISQAYEATAFAQFDRGNHPDVYFAGMLQYDGDALVPTNYLVDPPQIDDTMSEYMADSGIATFAVSETQKFGHVTFFWNGNRTGYFDEGLETYVEIPSDNIEFNQAPAMKAREITDATIELLRSGEYRFGRINLANGDMVGHTGDLAAAIEAMEVVDECVARLVDAIDDLNGVLIYTADHGNADIMYTEGDDGTVVPKTSHTLSRVPLVVHDSCYDGEYQVSVDPSMGLANVAATALNLLGYAAPYIYEPSLLQF